MKLGIRLAKAGEPEEKPEEQEEKIEQFDLFVVEKQIVYNKYKTICPIIVFRYRETGEGWFYTSECCNNIADVYANVEVGKIYTIECDSKKEIVRIVYELTEDGKIYCLFDQKIRTA